MKEKLINLDSGKNIWIYDNIFDYGTREVFHIFITNSWFRPATVDNGILEDRADISIASQYSLEDCEAVGIFPKIPEKIKQQHNLNYNRPVTSVLNLSQFSDRYHIHADTNANTTTESKTLLYYANLKWQVEWGGDTVFLDDTGEKIEYVSQYVPGRIVIFDSLIPHLIRPPTVLAPQYRFTYAMRFT